MDKLKLISALCLMAQIGLAQIKLNNVTRDTINVNPNFTCNVKDTKGGLKLRIVFDDFNQLVDSNRLNNFNLNKIDTYSILAYEASGSYYKKIFYVQGNKTPRPTITLCTVDSAKLYCNAPSADSIHWYVDSNYVKTLFKLDTFTVYSNGSIQSVQSDINNVFPISQIRSVTCIN